MTLGLTISIDRYQQSEYNIIPLPQIQDYLSNLVIMNPDIMYQISLLQEQKSQTKNRSSVGIELSSSGKFKERGFTVVRESHTHKPSLTETLKFFISGKPKDRSQQKISLQTTSTSNNSNNDSENSSDLRQSISSSLTPFQTTTSSSNNTSGEPEDAVRKTNKGIAKIFPKISHSPTIEETKN
jgi:hypothetical protein